MEMYLWLFGTAVIFTGVGAYMGTRSKVENIIAATIDSLIADGYLKTRGTGENMEILKWRDWDDQTD